MSNGLLCTGEKNLKKLFKKILEKKLIDLLGNVLRAFVGEFFCGVRNYFFFGVFFLGTFSGAFFFLNLLANSLWDTLTVFFLFFGEFFSGVYPDTLKNIISEEDPKKLEIMSEIIPGK